MEVCSKMVPVDHDHTRSATLRLHRRCLGVSLAARLNDETRAFEALSLDSLLERRRHRRIEKCCAPASIGPRLRQRKAAHSVPSPDIRATIAAQYQPSV